MNVPLPQSFGEITADWFGAALSDGGRNPGEPGTVVTDLVITPMAEGLAFLSDIAFAEATVTVGSAESRRQRFVVKVPASDPGGHTVGEMLNVWARESQFYAELAPLIDAPLATCRFNGAQPEHDRYLLVLDELADVVPADQTEGATIEQARAAVDALARIQAPWWGKPRTPDVEWVPGLDRPGAAEGLQAAMEGSIDRFIDRFGPSLPDEPLDWLRSFVPTLGDWRNDLATRPLTIAHADYRLANMIFGSDGSVTVVDWQTAMYTGGPTDLSFFLGTNLTVDLRRAHEDELVELYVETLRASGVAPDLLGHVRDDYEHAHLWWMGMLANNLSSIETPDPKSAALFDAMLTRLYTAAIDADCARFLAP